MRPHLFVTCADGLEHMLANELGAMGYRDLSIVRYGVYLYDIKPVPQSVYHINYTSRIATRVMLPLIQFNCRDKAQLYQHVRDFPWKSIFMKKDNGGNGKLSTLAIETVMRTLTDGFNHTNFPSLVAKDAICDHLRDQVGARPNVDAKNPDVLLNLHISEDSHATLSLDTSKVPLYKRGYRTTAGVAPLQESMAAAVLYAIGYGLGVSETGMPHFSKVNHDMVVYDPCCGSGTILVEAALIATQTPPGYFRPMTDWGFTNMPDFKLEEFNAIKQQEDNKKVQLPEGIRFYGTDVDAKTLAAATINAKNAGIASLCSFHNIDFQDSSNLRKILPSKKTLLVSNPPYGNRIDDKEVPRLQGLYKSLGSLMRHKDTALASIISTKELLQHTGLSEDSFVKTKNGGLPCRISTYH